MSYENSTLQMGYNNIIVGPNNSGKTNILRILKMVKNTEDIKFLGLPAQSRYNSYKDSILSLKISLTHTESKILEQIIFHDPLEGYKGNLFFSQIQVVIKWDSLTKNENTHPAEIILRISNGMTVLLKNNDNYIFYTDVIDLEDLEIKPPPPLDSNKEIFVKYKKIHKFESNNIFSADNYMHFVTRDKIRSYFTIDETSYGIKHSLQLVQTQPTQHYISSIFRYVGIKGSAAVQVSISFLLTSFFKKGISLVEEMHPSMKDMATKLFDIKSSKEMDYEKIKSIFSEIFPNVKFEIRRDSNQNARIIIHEHGKEFPIEQSSSGYFEIMHVLYQLHGQNAQSLFFDEPETHLHPNQARLLAEYIGNYGKDKNSSEHIKPHNLYRHWLYGENQITIITHAPALVNHALLSDTSKRLFYVKKKKSVSMVCAPSKAFCMDVKAGNFHSSIFFEKCTILVEGPSDEYAMKGLSDRKGGLLEKNSIALVNVGSKTHIPHYISLLQEYKIPYIAMADSDYNKNMEEVVKLESDLEGELEKHGWKRTRDNGAYITKILSHEAYDFMYNRIDNAKIEKCMLNQIMQKAIARTTS